MQYPRTFVSLWGPPKSGKTHLGMTWPKPMMAIEIGETGVEDLLHKFPDVDYRPLIIPVLRPQIEDHARLLDRFEALEQEAIKNPDLRTILIDSASHLWTSTYTVMTEEAHRQSERQKRNQADFNLANTYFEQIIQVLRQHRQLNIVLVNRHKEKYARLPDENGRMVLQTTGEIEARDYKGMENLAQIIIKTGMGTRVDPRTQRSIIVPRHTVETCRFDKSVEGTEMMNMTYDTLMERIFGGNDAAA